MLGKLTFLAGAGVGYVLGARAGRERYEQIMQQVRGVKERPEVQDALTTVKQQATEVASTATGAVQERASTAADAAKSKVGGPSSGSSTGGASASDYSSSSGFSSTGAGSASSGTPGTPVTPVAGAVTTPSVDVIVTDTTVDPLTDPLPGSTGTTGTTSSTTGLGTDSTPAPSITETFPSSSTDRPGTNS
ncbi:MAG: YtxH domain-containing protein [Actinomycetota bacterium]|nr:YtxH domain-containing protein [Actinomycetota bacterium]